MTSILYNWFRFHSGSRSWFLQYVKDVQHFTLVCPLLNSPLSLEPQWMSLIVPLSSPVFLSSTSTLSSPAFFVVFRAVPSNTFSWQRRNLLTFAEFPGGRVGRSGQMCPITHPWSRGFQTEHDYFQVKRSLHTGLCTVTSVTGLFDQVLRSLLCNCMQKPTQLSLAHWCDGFTLCWDSCFKDGSYVDTGAPAFFTLTQQLDPGHCGVYGRAMSWLPGSREKHL